MPVNHRDFSQASEASEVSTYPDRNQSMRRFSIPAPIICLSLTIAAHETAYSQVNIRAIEAPAGTTQAHAAAISDDGQIIVGHCASPQGSVAVRWLPDGSSEILWNGTATAVNWDGSTIAGLKSTSGGLSVYSSSSGFLGVSWGTEPTDVSLNGMRIVGERHTFFCLGVQSRGYVWQSPSSVAPSPTLHTSSCIGSSTPTGISADGSTIVGFASTDFGYTRAFRYSGSMLDLGALDGTASFAYGTNENGSVVIGTSGAGSHWEAFRWTADTGMEGLGRLPKSDYSTAKIVTADGTTVLGESGGRAFIWKSGMGMQDLLDYLTAQGLDPSGWDLQVIQGVSADGSTILVQGTHESTWGSWIVTGVVACDPQGSLDINKNGIADSCELDCNSNTLPDAYEIAEGLVADCNLDGTPDSCDIASGTPDCNLNGSPDSCDIAEGYASDYDANGIPDACQCLADLFPDRQVNGADLGIALSQWGMGPGAVADINRDRTVDGIDLAIILGSWGSCP